MSYSVHAAIMAFYGSVGRQAVRFTFGLHVPRLEPDRKFVMVQFPSCNAVGIVRFTLIFPASISFSYKVVGWKNIGAENIENAAGVNFILFLVRGPYWCFQEL